MNIYTKKQSETFFFRTMAAAVVACAAIAPGVAKEVKYSYSNPKDEVCTIGTSKAEVYDIAIVLNDKSLRGAKIVGIELPVPNAPQLTNYSAWISNQLNLEADEQGKKHNAPDFCSVEATAANGNLTARFDKPYTIGDEPVYVGYSFTVSQLGSDANDVTHYPVTVTAGYTEGALFIHTGRHYLKWADRGQDLNGISTMRVILDGDFADNSASIESVKDVKWQQDNATITLPVMLRSYGSQPISSLDFTYTFQGKTAEAHVDFATPLNPMFGQGSLVNFDIPNVYDLGTEPIKVTLSKINGQANPNNLNSTEFNLSILSLFPKKRPVVEEYTGLWCGWCPRGFVGMETMAKEQPEFIGIAYHNGDPMATVSEYPSNVTGYPSCFMDRSGNYLTPSVGTLRESWAERSEMYAPVEVNVVAGRAASEKDDICVSTTVRFVEQPQNPCLLSYVLIAHGLKDEAWGQANYFYNRYEQYMDDFYGAPNPIYGLTFNDVAVMASPFTGEEGSIPAPAKIRPYESIYHSYTFHTAGEKSSTGYDLIRAAGDNMEVVAIVTDTKTGEILNAAKTGINTTGVNTVAADGAKVVNEIYYDLNGVVHTAPANGLYIKRIIFDDGSSVCKKVMIK